MRYEGEVCPYCGNPFVEGDDVVVCPECAAPHHRACWFAHGHCAYEERHGTGYVWKKTPPPEPEPAQQPEPSRGEQGLDIVCPDCGKVSPNGTLRCPDCGALLVPFAMGEPPIAQFRAGFNPNEEYDGMKTGDVALYCRTGGASYIKKCRQREQGQRITFNWAALLFTPFWFFYRKLYKPGAILLGLYVALTLLSAPFAEPISKLESQMVSIYQDVFSVRLTEEPTTEAAQAAAEQTTAQAEEQATTEAAEQPTTEKERQELFNRKMIDLLRQNKKTLQIVGAFYLANILLHLFAALTADTFYLKKMKKDIETIRGNNADERTVQTLLFRKGGVSLLGGLGAYLSCQAVFYLFDYLSR